MNRSVDVARFALAVAIAFPGVVLVGLGALMLAAASLARGSAPEPVTAQDEREAATKRRIREVVERALARP